MGSLAKIKDSIAKDYEALFEKAMAAGREAGNNAKCVPMVVGIPTSLFSNEIDRSKPVYVVNDGVCGFATIQGLKGNTTFGKWLLKSNKGRKGYPSGIYIGSPICSQSLTRNEAACDAAVKVLRDAGIACYVNSRID